MSSVIYLAYRYLLHHRIKSGVLVASITLIFYLPAGLRVLVEQSSDELRARAVDTPLIVGAKGSPLELVLNSLYFESDTPAPSRYREARRVAESGFADAIPLYTRFHSGDHPIVGTTLDYFRFRGLRVADGRPPGLLGECVIGAEVSERDGLRPGDHVISSPETFLDIAGVQPLRMPVAGVLARSGTPDDRAVFVDIKTAWVIEGLAHGHQDLSKPEAASGVLRREGDVIVANASVMQYAEITRDNVDSFHFHGDTETFPISAVIVIPNDEKSAALLRGRYLADDELAQIVLPVGVIEELLGTVLTVQTYVVAAVVIVGLSTLATACLVFLLSIRLRSREIETMHRIGGSRGRVVAILASEIGAVMLLGIVIATVLTALTSQFGAAILREVIL